MYNLLLITQTVFSIILIVLILMQASEGGAGGLFGSGGETYHTRRGVEKVIYYATIFSLVVFVINSVALLLV
jgi:protein translocase SecG subunit